MYQSVINTCAKKPDNGIDGTLLNGLQSTKSEFFKKVALGGRECRRFETAQMPRSLGLHFVL